jgi:cytoskeletal protein CcmA (bactofilin family)
MATRYWVGGGSSANWNATGNTNWGTASGVQDNASVPTSADDVIFDGAGANGNDNSTISATITILSLDIQTGYTGTMTHNAVLTIAGNWTYTGNYTIAGASGITISAASTITSNGVTWTNALTFSGANTKTLVGNLSVTGLLTIPSSSATVLNQTTTETITVSGGIAVNAALSGTAKIILKGGTWSGNNALSNNLDIDGNVTISGSVFKQDASLTYVSGNVTTSGSLIILGGTLTLNSGNIIWNNIVCPAALTIESDLIIRGYLDPGAQNRVYNSINNAVIKTNSIIGGNDIRVISGNADIYILQSWSCLSRFSKNIFIDGNVTISGQVYMQNGTLKYLQGNVNSKNGTLRLTGNSTVLNFNKCPLSSVLILAGITVTMNEFFSGTPSQSCVISSTGANYTIAFQDGFEKIGRFVQLSGATIANRGQLLVTNNSRFNTNRSTNIGVRYINQSPNGFPKGSPSITDTMTVPALGLVSDPNFIKQ